MGGREPVELKGVAAAPGLRLGRARLLAAIPAVPARRAAADPAVELGRWQAARQAVHARLSQLAERLEAEGAAAEAGILRAQALMAADPELDGEVVRRLHEGATAEDAVREATAAYAALLEGLSDPYLRERALDVRDVGQELLQALCGQEDRGPEEGAEGPVVLAGHEVTPSQLARWRRRAAAVVMEAGGATAHVALMARGLGLPAVTGVEGLLGVLGEGDEVLVDGDRGRVVVRPGPEDRAMAAARAEAEAAFRARLPELRELPATTRDGYRVELGINIGHPDEIAAAEPYGPEGVGLFRTEFLFSDRQDPPGEEEQYRAYLRAVQALAGRRLVLRTLDAGADKPLPFAGAEPEPNPALGWRGARMGLDRPDLLRTQLRAALRAAAHGPVAIMFPMVTVREEVRRLRRLLAEAAAELAAEGVPAGPVEAGIMVETPAAALCARVLAREVDFFSIGTNDLTQYVLAVDRTAARVQHLYDHLHPAVLRLIAETAAAAREAGIWVGVCGELAGEPLAAPFFVGVGVHELSMVPPQLPRVKEVIRAIDRESAARLVPELLLLGDGGEVRARLLSYLAGLGVPLPA